ncbi:O-antigen ligase family protein [Rhodopirellula sp. JC639]|uniref:O-antigen ligase family protein n=1 Tax=Stieleria mannarensis TaxID=2755585 RepID=UPI0016041286|nr:O-antigen ligase family protein [Rhodopirellula sp. JC639]
MATAVFNTTDHNTIPRIDGDVDDRHGWGFALLLATTATLFVRPADLVPALDNWPIYQFLIVACMIVSARACLNQISNAKLIERPVTASLLVLLVAVAVSHLSHGFLWAARMSTYEVGKLIALYALITGLVNTPARLEFFVRWLTITITTMATLVLLDHFGILSIAALESIQDRGVVQDGTAEQVERIRGTGIFQDPNDLGLILVTGLVFCASFLTKPRTGLVRYGWLIPAAVLMSALALTHSRGALLSLICAISTGLCYFRGGKLSVLALPALSLMALAFSSRMSDVNAIHEGTGQDRIQIWSDSMGVWRQYPLFGLGEGLIVDEIGVVTHNSFLHCFAELGFFGGTAFVACFLAAGIGLWSWRRRRENRPADPMPINEPTDAIRHRTQTHGQQSPLTFGPGRSRQTGDLTCDRMDTVDDSVIEHARVCGFLFAALMGCIAAMLTISRQFVAPTYLILGLVAAAVNIPLDATPQGKPVDLRIGNRFLIVSLLAGAASLLVFYVTIRLLVRW